jgi:hypothetical protein
VVEQRMVELLRPDWYLDGPAAAEDLHRAVRTALQDALSQLNAPRSGLRSKLLRALPTTMALLALQRTTAAGRWVAHVLWAGDSRAYVLDRDGLHQLTSDHLRDPGDAMANLRQDSVVGNAMSADVDFTISYRQVDLEPPFLALCATDGCFGYVPSPMHFEHLLVSTLQEADDQAGWSAALQREFAAVTGDDAAMAALAIGVDFEGLQALFAGRSGELAEGFVQPMAAASEAVARAEAALEAARREEVETTSRLWSGYKHAYERHLTDGGAGRAGTPDDVHRAELLDLWGGDAASEEAASEEEAP